MVKSLLQTQTFHGKQRKHGPKMVMTDLAMVINAGFHYCFCKGGAVDAINQLPADM